MKSKVFLVISLVFVVLASSLLGLTFSGCANTGASAADVQPVNVSINNQQGIWVNGQGTVTVTPDIATVNLGVSAQAATVADAQSRAATAMDKIIAALKSNGVADKDMQTRYFNIQQMTRYDNNSQQSVVTGYMVSNTITVKIRKMDKVGSIIDAVAAAGGDYTRVNGVSFSVDKPEQYYETARTKAMEDAKTKAEQLARLSGVSLGKATYVSENTSNPSPIYYSGAAYAKDIQNEAVTPISPGETDIVINVQVAFAIE
jgi:uncharacterized protein YggE